MKYSLRNIIFIIGLAFGPAFNLITSHSFGQDLRGELKLWPFQNERTVYVPFIPEISLELTKISNDRDNWGSLSIQADYKGNLNQVVQRRLGSQYKNSNLKWIQSQGTGDATVRIPGLDDLVFSTKDHAQGGPFFGGIIILTKAKYQQVRKVLQQKLEGIQVSLPTNVAFFHNRRIEGITLSREDCRQFFRSGHEFISVISQINGWAQSLKVKFKYPQTRNLIQVEAMKSCLSLNSPTKIYSFSDLLQLKIETQNQFESRWIGKTRRESVRDSFNLPYVIQGSIYE